MVQSTPGRRVERIVSGKRVASVPAAENFLSFVIPSLSLSLFSRLYRLFFFTVHFIS